MNKPGFPVLCDGVVKEGSAREILGDDEVESLSNDGGVSVDSGGYLANCEAREKGKTRYATFSIGTADSSSKIVQQTLHDDLFGTAASAPLGAGWPGTLTMQGRITADATIVLKCGPGRPDYLLVDTKLQLSSIDTSFSSDEERLGLARAAAAVSKEANEKWECGADLGRPIRHAPADMTKDAPQPLSEATGTCRSMRQLAPAAKKWGITRAIGSAAVEEAPTQDCLLVNDEGKKVYRLSTLSGPLAQGYRSSSGVLGEVNGKAGRSEQSSGWAWASAKCPEGQPSALFTAASMRIGDEDRLEVSPAFERDLLKAFGSDMAALHGCEKPTLP